MSSLWTVLGLYTAACTVGVAIGVFLVNLWTWFTEDKVQPVKTTPVQRVSPLKAYEDAQTRVRRAKPLPTNYHWIH